MKGLLLKVLAPIAAIGALFGAAYSAKKFGLIEEGTWTFLWPSLVAIVFLGLAVLVFLAAARRWLWPLITGFVVQSFGVLFYALEVLDKPWETLLWTGIAVGVVLIGMGIFYLEVYRRARKTEKGMLEAGFEDGVDPEELDKIRDNMLEAIEMMRRAGRGRNAIYQLPWFLVVGRPSAGKTVAIKESGLGLPVKKDWVKGVGGTYSCDFFFTNDLIFMDTPGRWVRDGADDAAKRLWESLLKLLRRYRGRRPLDGLVVVVSAEDLAGSEVDPEDRVKLEDQAANIREIIDLMHDNLNFRFPIYLLVSKVDLITGFTDFFWGIPAQRRNEILGWSNPDPSDLRVEAMINTGLDSVLNRLQQYRLEFLAKLGRKSRNRRLFFFTEELKQIRGPLADFARVLFYEDPSRQAPIFRGFYFTSGMQGVGSPVSVALAGLARNLKLPPRPATATTAEEEGKRSYFLLELFRELMVGDEGLIGRTAKHWWKQRRNTLFGAFLPAGLALAILFLSGVSLLWNRSLYNEMEREIPRIVSQLETAPDGTLVAEQELSYETLTERLETTERLRTYHRKLTNLNPFRRFGMRRTEELSRETFQVYKRQFSEAVLRPTLRLAQQKAMTSSCVDRVDVFHSVIWMRLGLRFDTSEENMAGFNVVWSDLDLEPEQNQELRAELLSQFRYLVQHDPTENVGGLLAGFPMLPVAKAIREDCDMAGAGSPLDQYRLFEERCASWRSDCELKQCYESLEKVAKWKELDTDRYLKNVRQLKESLQKLKVDESEAQDALAEIELMDLGKQDTSVCVAKFSSLLEPLAAFAVPSELLAECRNEISDLPTTAEKRQRRTEVITAQVANLSVAEAALKQSMATYIAECKFETLVPFNIGLDFSIVDNVAYDYRRKACLKPIKCSSDTRSPVATTVTRPRRQPRQRAQSPAPRKGGGQSPQRAAAVRVWGPFQTGCTPASGYRVAGWERNLSDWSSQFEAANDPRMREADRQNEKRGVENRIRAFGSRLSSKWLECLGEYRLLEPETDLGSWLETLATSQHFGELFEKPGADAMEISGAAAAPPLDAVLPELKPLLDLQEFGAGTVTEYQDMLGALGEEVRAMQSDPDRFLAYQRAYGARSPENSLVKLQAWVRNNVARVAEKKLLSMFNQPLTHVEGFVTGDTLITSLWERLAQSYDHGITSRFPFAPDNSAPDLESVELGALVSVFGFQSGAAHKLDSGTAELGPQSRAWLERAQAISGIAVQARHR